MYQSSIAMMSISMLLCFMLPLSALLFMKLRYGALLKTAICGISSFMLFVMVIENLLHNLVLPRIEGNGALYVVYAVLAAGVFEETGRYLCFRFLLRDDWRQGLATPLMYGIGHGGTEAVIAGLSMFMSVTVMALVGESGLSGALALMSEGMDAAQLAALELDLQSIERLLADNAPVYFLAGGAERVLALALHMSLSVLVYLSVLPGRPLWLYPAAAGLHALVNVPAALYQVGALTGVWATEGILLLLTAGLVALTVLVWRRWGDKGLSRRSRGDTGDFGGRRLPDRR